jgi:hypothetical protein
MKEWFFAKMSKSGLYLLITMILVPVRVSAQTIIDDLDKPEKNKVQEKKDSSESKKEVYPPKVSPSKAEKQSDVETSSEGFIVETEDKASRKSDGKKIKKLIDDPGTGEIVPRRMVELNFGIGGADIIPLNTGLNIGASLLYWFKGEVWGGAGFNLMMNSGDGYFERVLTWEIASELRYYFMPHHEANRFVLAHLLLELGYSSFGSSGDGIDLNRAGFFTGIGIGIGKALSTNTYIGIKFKYVIPFWGDLETSGCPISGCGLEEDDLDITFWQFSAFISYGF